LASAVCSNTMLLADRLADSFAALRPSKKVQNLGNSFGFRSTYLFPIYPLND
jgi:hypothetical protein